MGGNKRRAKIRQHVGLRPLSLLQGVAHILLSSHRQPVNRQMTALFLLACSALLINFGNTHNYLIPAPSAFKPTSDHLFKLQALQVLLASQANTLSPLKRSDHQGNRTMSRYVPSDGMNRSGFDENGAQQVRACWKPRFVHPFSHLISEKVHMLPSRYQ